jgi:hypothetical protein
MPLTQTETLLYQDHAKRPSAVRASYKTNTVARDELYSAFADLISVNAELDRSLVSFQANKNQPIYGWFKYKEGFSSRLVDYVLDQIEKKIGVLLDPFAGSGAALFAASRRGWSGIGIEVLPVGFHAMAVRQEARRADPVLFAREVSRAATVDFSAHYSRDRDFRHIAITDGAFPPATEKQLAGFRSYCENRVSVPAVRSLFDFAAFCVLEEVSYTRKDGQYLRWDYRSSRTRVVGEFDKGRIPGFREAVLRKLQTMADDLSGAASLIPDSSGPQGALDLRKGSCLEVLPELPAASVDLVLTSPPYCNRYDYTRTYALELAFLGHGESEVKALRQAMLSCTVENKEKVEDLRRSYAARRQGRRFETVQAAFKGQPALHEVLEALERCRNSGILNNTNVPRMVRNYFYEMCFVIFEMARLLRPGGRIVMVNDNVRYGGEEVPVDLILSDFAQKFGLTVSHIWTLPRGKGNSSQQMGLHGRRELRKCVYVWEKPRKVVR